MATKITANDRIHRLEELLRRWNSDEGEEALELCEAIREDVEDMQVSEAKEELNYQDSFNGFDEIRYEANNLMDNQVMQAVEEAFGKYTHTQILEKLK